MTKHARIIGIIAALALMFFAGCTEKAERPETPDHLGEAQRLRSEPGMLALSIWHYEQFIAEGGEDSSALAVARLQLDECRRVYFAAHTQDGARDNSQRDLELKLKFQEQRNNELESWVSRLNRENAALRQSLLSAQQRSGEN